MCIFRKKFKTREVYSQIAKRDYSNIKSKNSNKNEDDENENDKNKLNTSKINNK